MSSRAQRGTNACYYNVTTIPNEVRDLVQVFIRGFSSPIMLKSPLLQSPFLFLPMNIRYYIYIVTNPQREVLYTGLTNDLQTRIIEHYQNRGNEQTFTGKYYCYNLIYYEGFNYINDAIAREKKSRDGEEKRR